MLNFFPFFSRIHHVKGFNRDVWEAQLEMKDFGEEEIEEEIQEIIISGKSMAAAEAEPSDNNIMPP